MYCFSNDNAGCRQRRAINRDCGIGQLVDIDHAGWVSLNRCRTTAEPIKPAPPVTKTVQSLKCTCLRLRIKWQRTDNHSNIRHSCFCRFFLPIARMLVAKYSPPQRNLFGASDPQSLALLQNLNEVACFNQRRMRAGIEPGKTTAKDLDIEVATFQVGAVDVGDLELAACRRLDVGGDVEDVIVVKVEPGDRDIRLRMLGLFLDRQRAPRSANSTTPYCSGVSPRSRTRWRRFCARWLSPASRASHAHRRCCRRESARLRPDQRIRGQR